MVRRSDTDLAGTLSILHNAVLHTGTDLRDALDKSVAKLEANGQAAHEQTTKTVVEELSRMRTDFRDVRNRLTASGETLSSEVHNVVTSLRTELREVRVVLADLAPAPVPGLDEGARAEPAAVGAAEAPVTTVTGHDALVEKAAPAGIPAGSAGEYGLLPGPVPAVDAVRDTLREVLAEVLAPMLSPFTDQDRHGRDRAGERDDALERLRETAGEIKGELSSALEEARVELAGLRQEVAGLRTVVEELQPQPSVSSEPADAERSAPTDAERDQAEAHSRLLRRAAQVSSAGLSCHRDVWEFVTAHAGRHPHFRVPPQVTGEEDERIRAALSGRSLIALLISLHSIVHTADDGNGDQELAATLYERIEESLTGLTSSGEPVSITLDDRAPAQDTPAPAAAPGAASGDEPEDTGPPAPGEQDPQPGEDADPPDHKGS
ncbi:hypothetical protein ABT391_29130 [Streptomyces jumonjinensis]|uniref:hypothetical protein n=1 Tax=Streptomyces jumonjinensis TaxID=1945 RepID=UPI003331DCE9